MKGIGELRDRAPISWIFFATGASPSFLQKALACRLSETDPVVIVERPVSALRQPGRWPLSRRRQGMEYQPFFWPQRIPLFGDWSQRRNLRYLSSELDRLGPGPVRVVVFDSPAHYQLVGKLKEALSVYLAIDDRTLTLAGIPIAGELEAERELLRRVDIVLGVSKPLARLLRRRMPGDARAGVHVLANGFDERLFSPVSSFPEPIGLHGVSRPLVLIVGHVSERLDWLGLSDCRRRRPAAQWLFLGPMEKGMKKRIIQLGGHHRPPVPLSEVPAWLACADVCAVPYRRNRFTQASCPIKALEYLAMGAPTLSTRIPSLNHLGAAVQWVREGDGGSYAAALDRLLTTEYTQASCRRRAAVASDTLGYRVHAFRRLVAQALRIADDQPRTTSVR